MKKILFISGSLRKESLNTDLLHQAAKSFDGFECSFLDYGDLPLLDQDLEFPPPASLVRIRQEVVDSDALFIASPEYNRSYSAALKNLLDWLSRPVAPGDYSSVVIKGKLVAVCSVAGSSGGRFSMDCLASLLETLSCKLVVERTSIALGERFGKLSLVLTDDEASALGRECEALKSMLMEA